MNDNQNSFSIVQIEERNIDDIMVLQDVIVNDLNDSAVFNASPRETLLQNIATKGRMVGIFHEKMLIAYHSVYYPDQQDTDYNLGRDIGLPDSEVRNMANIQNILVHPKWRGNQFGMKMNEAAIAYLKNNSYRHILATVSPKNIFSINIFCKSGFIIKDLKLKYGDKLRFIYYRDLQASP